MGKRFLLALLCAALCITGTAHGYTGVGVGSVWSMRSGTFVATPYDGTNAGVALMDASFVTTGLGQLGPGTEGLTLPSYLPGHCYLWARYDAWRVVGTPFEAWPRGVRQMRVDSLGVHADSVLTTPRLGPYSTYNSGGAIRIVDGVTFPLTVAGVQAALDECEAIGGGTTVVPSNAGIPVSNVGVKIPNRVRLLGLGDHGSLGTFACTATCNVGAVIENKSINGNQSYAYVEHIQIIGNLGAGATDSVGIRFRSVYIGSAIRNCLLLFIKGTGIVLDDPGNHGFGPFVLDNIGINAPAGDGIQIGTSSDNGYLSNYWLTNINVERWGATNAAIRYTGYTAGSGVSLGGHLLGGYFEPTDGANQDGIVVKNVTNLTLDNITFRGAGPMNYPVKIEGNATTADHGSYGLTVRNLYCNNDTILFDQVNNFALTNANGGMVYEYRTPSKAPSVIPYEVISDSLRVNKTTLLVGDVVVGPGSGASGYVKVGQGAVDATYGTVEANSGTTGEARMFLSQNGVQKSRWAFSGGETYMDYTSGFHFRNGIGGSDVALVGGTGTDITGRLTATDSLRANKGMYLGGQKVNKFLRNSATLDFDLSAVVSQDLTITVTGAAVGDDVVPGIPNGSVTADTVFYMWVSAANTVTVRATRTAGTPNPASGTFKCTVIQ